MTDQANKSRIAQVRAAFEADETRILDEHQIGPWARGDQNARFGCILRADFEAECMPRENAVPFDRAQCLLDLRYPSDGESGDDVRVALWRISETEALSITTWLPPYSDDEGDGNGHIKYYQWDPLDVPEGISRLLAETRSEAVEDLLAPLRGNLQDLVDDEANPVAFANTFIAALRVADPARSFALSREVSLAAEAWYGREARAVLQQSSKVTRIDVETDTAIDDEGGVYRDVVSISVTASDGTQLDFRGDYEWWDALEGSGAEDDIGPLESEEQARGTLEALFGCPDWPLFWQALYSIAARSDQLDLELTGEAAS